MKEIRVIDKYGCIRYKDTFLKVISPLVRPYDRVLVVLNGSGFSLFCQSGHIELPFVEIRLSDILSKTSDSHTCEGCTSHNSGKCLHSGSC